MKTRTIGAAGFFVALVASIIVIRYCLQSLLEA